MCQYSSIAMVTAKLYYSLWYHPVSEHASPGALMGTLPTRWQSLQRAMKHTHTRTHAETETHRNKHTHRHTQKQKHTQTQTQRHTHPHSPKHTHSHTHTPTLSCQAEPLAHPVLCSLSHPVLCSLSQAWRRRCPELWGSCSSTESSRGPTCCTTMRPSSSREEMTCSSSVRPGRRSS